MPLEGKRALPLPRLPAVGVRYLHLPIHPGEGGLGVLSQPPRGLLWRVVGGDDEPQPAPVGGLQVVARPYAGVRGVWVREGAEVPEIPRERGFRPLPKRWVEERTFAWLGRNRRLAKDYEENPGVSEAWVYLGMPRLLVKRLARAV